MGLERRKNFYLYNSELGNLARSKLYINLSAAHIHKKKLGKRHYFNFNLYNQKKIYDSYSKRSLRDKFDAYFTSFFSSYYNYNNWNGTKKIITCFIPRLNMYPNSLKTFFGTYNSGYLISIIRHPIDWLVSAQKHDKQYENPNDALNLWLSSALSSIEAEKDYENIKIILFKDIITNTEKVMKKLCKIFKINFEKILLTPTFNSEKTSSASSFEPVDGKIDQDTLNRQELLSNETVKKFDKTIFNKCIKLYEQIIKKYSHKD